MRFTFLPDWRDQPQPCKPGHEPDLSGASDALEKPPVMLANFFRSPRSLAPRRALPTIEGMETSALLTTYSLIVHVDIDVSEGQEGPNAIGLPAPGRTVFLDLNHDQKLDPGDPSGVTGADGTYTFTGLSAGLYDV